MAHASGDVAKTIFDELAKQARTSFAGVVVDIEKDVVPTMAMLAQNLVVIGGRLASHEYSQQDADDEVTATLNAAASVIVRFANEILARIQALLDTLLSAVSAAVNNALGVALL